MAPSVTTHELRYEAGELERRRTELRRLRLDLADGFEGRAALLVDELRLADDALGSAIAQVRGVANALARLDPSSDVLA